MHRKGGSDIPRARAILQEALDNGLDGFDSRNAIRQALALMTRRKPTKRAVTKYPKLTGPTAREAVRLHRQERQLVLVARMLPPLR